MKTRERGFTYIELFVTIAIAATTLTIGVPSFRDFVCNNRLTSVANELVLIFHLARTEAINRAVTVTVCKSSDSATCANSGGWDQGWIVFTDIDKDATYDSDTETLLRTQEPIEDNVTLSPSVSIEDYISYVSSGRSSSLGGMITLCDDRSGDVGRNVVVNATGRAHVATGITCS